MTPDQLAAASGNSAWMLISAALVLLMTPALALFYGGLSDKRSVLNMMMMSFGALGVVCVVYVLWGWSMSYGTQSWGGVVANPFEFFGLRDSITDADGNYIAGASGYANVIDIGFQLTFAVISTAIISGALLGRVKFGTWLALSGLWVTFVYFPLAHMVWGGGLLSHAERSLSSWIFGTVTEAGETTAAVSPVDFAGGTVVHISAGTAALVLAIVVGKRAGWPTKVSRPHNLPMVMTGAALLFFGWFGFNGGSAFAADGLAGLAWLNTAAATAAAMLGWMAVEAIRDKAATSLGAASGVVAGLVAITPAAGALTPVTSLILGGIGGAVACLGVGLKYTFGFDDSLDAVGVHLVAGLWGTIGLALFASEGGLLTDDAGYGVKLLIIQTVIAVVAMVFAGIVTLVIALALKHTLGWRIEDEDEAAGVDVSEHRESGYDLAAQSGMRAPATMIGSTNNSTAPTIPPRTDVKE
ncbi:ammonium transporter [Corynebacterium phoceense]|uniref:ammonium transporter n=1 Tax=Corynebacterium phoceense TaxID=1686286 RepID=UPI00211BA2A4|nr:ammonium transporter [Corynebacterium phoceense]MCQ9340263.1 ammonium transporter [Corynebacterium phoceense]